MRTTSGDLQSYISEALNSLIPPSKEEAPEQQGARHCENPQNCSSCKVCPNLSLLPNMDESNFSVQARLEEDLQSKSNDVIFKPKMMIIKSDSLNSTAHEDSLAKHEIDALMQKNAKQAALIKFLERKCAHNITKSTKNLQTRIAELEAQNAALTIKLSLLDKQPLPNALFEKINNAILTLGQPELREIIVLQSNQMKKYIVQMENKDKQIQRLAQNNLILKETLKEISSSPQFSSNKENQASAGNCAKAKLLEFVHAQVQACIEQSVMNDSLSEENDSLKSKIMQLELEMGDLKEDLKFFSDKVESCYMGFSQEKELFQSFDNSPNGEQLRISPSKLSLSSAPEVSIYESYYFEIAQIFGIEEGESHEEQHEKLLDQILRMKSQMAQLVKQIKNSNRQLTNMVRNENELRSALMAEQSEIEYLQQYNENISALLISSNEQIMSQHLSILNNRLKWGGEGRQQQADACLEGADNSLE